MSHIPIFPINHIINDFQIQEILGQGAFGSVYKVIDSKNQVYALKCILKSRFKEVNGYVGQLIMNETNALQQLNCQYIVKLISTFDYIYYKETIFCIQLEFCDGGTLLNYLQENSRTFSQLNAITLFKQILQGMKEIHQKRIIHRDLKLLNILMHKNQIKIADFGFCHILNPDQSQVQLNLGTLGYQAPEILDNQSYGLKSDMFSIGVIFYQLLFLEFPFEYQDEKAFLNAVSYQNPPSFKKNGRMIEKYLEDLLTKMLKKNPAERLNWTTLFKSKLFEKNYSCISLFNEEIFGQSTIEDEDTFDPIQSYIYYQQQQKVDHKFLESQILMVQNNQEYLDSKDQIEFLIYTYEFSSKIYHRQTLMCIFPCFLILKQIYQKQQQYKQLYQLQTYDLTNTHQILAFQYQIMMANLDRIKKLNFMDKDSESESLNISTSPQFQNIFQNAVMKYLSKLKQEILQDSKDQEIQWQDVLFLEDHQTTQNIKNILQKLKFFVLVYFTLFLENLTKDQFDELIKDNQISSNQQYIYVDTFNKII